MKAHLLALGTVFVWGITFVSTKVLLVDFSPFWILVIRFALGFCALCVLRPHRLVMEGPRDRWLFVGAGLTGTALYFFTENVALALTTATTVGVIVAASPLFTMVLAAALGSRSSLNVRFFLGFVVAMGGLALVSFGGLPEAAEAVANTSAVAGAHADEGTALLGDGLALAAALMWGIYSTLVNRINAKGYDTVAATKNIFFWGLVFMVPMALVAGGSLPAPGAFLKPENFLNLLFLGLIASALCFVTWNYAVDKLGPVITSTYIYLVPAVTTATSVVVLGEPLTFAIVFGIALTIAGLVLSQSKPRKGAPTR